MSLLSFSNITGRQQEQIGEVVQRTETPSTDYIIVQRPAGIRPGLLACSHGTNQPAASSPLPGVTDPVFVRQTMTSSPTRARARALISGQAAKPPEPEVLRHKVSCGVNYHLAGSEEILERRGLNVEAQIQSLSVEV